MKAQWIVSDWLGHVLYGFAGKEEADRYVALFDPREFRGTMRGMTVRAASKWDRVEARRITETPSGYRIVPLAA